MNVLISGSPKPFSMMEGIGPDVDAVFFVGYHAASGTGTAVLEHTWSGGIVEVRLNGRVVGELVPGSTRIDGRTVEWTGDDMPAVYKVFRAMTALAWSGG